MVLEISRKILINFITIITLFTLILAGYYILEAEKNEFYNEVMDIEIRELEYYGIMDSTINRIGMDMYEYTLSFDKEELEEEVEELMPEFETAQDNAYALLVDEQKEDDADIYKANEQKLLEIGRLYDEIKNDISQISENAEEMEHEELVRKIYSTEGKIIEVSNTLKQIINDEQGYLNDKADSFKRKTGIIMIFMFLIIIGAILISIRISLLTSRKVRKSLKDVETTLIEVENNISEIEGYVQELEKGNIALNIDTSSKKGRMLTFSQTMNKFNENMRRMTSKIKDASSLFEASSNELLYTNQLIEQNSKKVVATVGLVAESAEAQYKKVGHANEVMDKFHEDLKVLLSNTKNVSESIESSNKKAQVGSDAAKKASEKIGLMKNSVKRSSESISSLKSKSEEVGKIISVINDIAEQTNLLALNAAIEAARAGDAGRGFAVVADEVRKLAEQSKKSARQISDIVLSIQTTTNESTDSIERTVDEINQSSEIINTALTSLEDIAKIMDATAKKSIETLNIAEKQENDMKPIKENLAEINFSSESNFAAASEVNMSIQKQAKITEAAQNLATNLVSTSTDIKKLLDDFKG